MSRQAMILSAAMAALLGGGMPDRRHARVLTLDEEEERSVQRMKDRAAGERRRSERERRQAAARLAAKLAAEAEAARPKSRQELRFAERKKAKRLRENRCFQKQERRP